MAARYSKQVSTNFTACITGMDFIFHSISTRFAQTLMNARGGSHVTGMLCAPIQL